MRFKEINYNNQSISIYDDLLDYHDRKLYFSSFLSGSFKFGGSDEYFYGIGNQFYSQYSLNESQVLNFLNNKNLKQLIDTHRLTDYAITYLRINATMPGETCRIHSDSTGVTLIYYVNLDWNLEHGGHLAIIDQNLLEINSVVTYVPGRIIVLPGTIPHQILTVSPLASRPRFSLAIQFG